ncbi:MAG: PilZ domain-containing protein [Deltaproteobacteria bacterium]|nr:PilZ domain-containing protein [Deltaproteobacteria bacterium]
MSRKDLEDSLNFIHNCRRSHDRIPWKSQVTVDFETGRVDGETVNISLGGAYIVFSGNAAPGDILKIELPIPGVENCHLNAEVRWFLPHRDNKTGCGLKFLNITDSMLKALANITNNSELRDI